MAPGTALLVIARAGHAVARAWAVAPHGLGLLAMLDDKEPQGLASLTATAVATRDEGTQVSSGPWQGPRPADPRQFVMVEPPEGKTLVDWGTPQVQAPLAAAEGPPGYRERREMQANSCKRLIAHGALQTN